MSLAPVLAPHPSPLSGSALRRAGLSLVLMAVCVLIYHPTSRFDFVRFDDQAYIYENPMVRRGLTLDGLRWAFTTTAVSNWHPLTWMAHMLDVELFGLRPGAHHLVSVLIHGLNSVLLFWMLTRMTGGKIWPSLWVALLFACHPLRVESVAWVAERKDVLAAFFGVIALLAYAAYARGRSWISYLASVVALAASLMCKPMLVTLPCLLLLLDHWPLGRWMSSPTRGCEHRRLRWLLLEKTPHALLALLSCIITYRVQQASGAMRSFEVLSLPERTANAAISYVRYLVHAIAPVDLAPLYPLPPQVALMPALAAGVFLLAVSAICLKRLGEHPYLAVGWFWYLGTLVPVIGLIQVGAQAMADRYTYLPLVGIFIGVVFFSDALIDAKPAVKPWILTAAVCVIGMFAVTAHRQTFIWRDSVSLFRHAIAVTQDNAIAHNNLAGALALEGNCDQAVFHYRRAIDIGPARAEWYGNLANALAHCGRLTQAFVLFERSLTMNPNQTAVLRNYASFLIKAGKQAMAQRTLERLMRLAPRDADALHKLGVSQFLAGDAEGAARQFRRALELDPDNGAIREHLNQAQTMLNR
jgi:tetratricopeptide (TPR) repeat protein